MDINTQYLVPLAKIMAAAQVRTGALYLNARTHKHTYETRKEASTVYSSINCDRKERKKNNNEHQLNSLHFTCPIFTQKLSL